MAKDDIQEEKDNWPAKVRLTFLQLEQLCEYINWVIGEHTIGVGPCAGNKPYRSRWKSMHMEQLVPIAERLDADLEDGRKNIPEDKLAHAALSIEGPRSFMWTLSNWAHIARRLSGENLHSDFLGALKQVDESIRISGEEWLSTSLGKDIADLRKAGLSPDQIRDMSPDQPPNLNG